MASASKPLETGSLEAGAPEPASALAIYFSSFSMRMIVFSGGFLLANMSYSWSMSAFMSKPSPFISGIFLWRSISMSFECWSRVSLTVIDRNSKETSQLDRNVYIETKSREEMKLTKKLTVFEHVGDVAVGERYVHVEVLYRDIHVAYPLFVVLALCLELASDFLEKRNFLRIFGDTVTIPIISE